MLLCVWFVFFVWLVLWYECEMRECVFVGLCAYYMCVFECVLCVVCLSGCVKSTNCKRPTTRLHKTRANISCYVH